MCVCPQRSAASLTDSAAKPWSGSAASFTATAATWWRRGKYVIFCRVQGWGEIMLLLVNLVPNSVCGGGGLTVCLEVGNGQFSVCQSSQLTWMGRRCWWGGGAGGWGVREGKGVWGRGCCGGEGGVAVGVEIEGLLFQFTAVGWRLKAYFSSSQQWGGDWRPTFPVHSSGVEIEGLLFQFTAVGWRLKAYFSSSQQWGGDWRPTFPVHSSGVEIEGLLFQFTAVFFRFIAPDSGDCCQSWRRGKILCWTGQVAIISLCLLPPTPIEISSMVGHVSPILFVLADCTLASLFVEWL